MYDFFLNLRHCPLPFTDQTLLPSYPYPLPSTPNPHQPPNSQHPALPGSANLLATSLNQSCPAPSANQGLIDEAPGDAWWGSGALHTNHPDSVWRVTADYC